MKNDQGILFVFKNTRPSSVPAISQIFKKGFSTKGTGRGMGLHIVSQLCDANEKLSLNTHVDDNNFTQELFIISG